jgi:two-component system, sensor histidine kinase PdtaS
MISNAIKHGLAGQSVGRVIVRGREEDGWVYVQVSDNGKGPAFNLQFGENSESSSEGLGLSLIKNLAGDLEGQFSLRREYDPASQNGTNNNSDGPEEYTVAEVRFPLVRRSRTRE